MMEDNGAITWSQLIGASSALTMLITGAFGYVLRAVGQQGKRIDEVNKKVEDHKVKVAEEYATTDVVIQIETRLTESINRMSDQLTGAMGHLTTRFEAMFSQVIDIARGKAE